MKTVFRFYTRLKTSHSGTRIKCGMNFAINLRHIENGFGDTTQTFMRLAAMDHLTTEGGLDANGKCLMFLLSYFFILWRNSVFFTQYGQTAVTYMPENSSS